MSLPPPLLVSPVDHLSPEDRIKFEDHAVRIRQVQSGDVVSFPFPLALYHRIDGIWFPVSDLGALHAPVSGPEKSEPVESSYAPPQFVVDRDDD